MEAAAVQYVTALQQARAHEKDRRNLRRKRRNEYLSALQDELDQSNRNALHTHIHLPTPTRSQMEMNLVAFVQKTAVWWSALCDQSIEQRLRYEKSVEDQKLRRKEYLNNVEKRENSEYQAVCDSEAARWANMQEEYKDYEEHMRAEMVDKVRQSVNEAASECVRLMNYYEIESAKDNWLIQFAFKKITNEAEFSRKPEFQHVDAFQAIFGTKNAFGLTGISFKELLDFAYQRCDSDKRATYEFDACEVPIVMLEGAKLSGKSLLADALEKKFTLRRFNDRMLIEKALNAHVEGPMDSDSQYKKTSAYNDLSHPQQSGGEEGSSKVASCEANGKELSAGPEQNGESLNTLLTTDTASPTGPNPVVSYEAAAEAAAEENEGGRDEESQTPKIASSAGESVEMSAKSEKVRHSKARWVELGNIIRDKLYRGEAVDQAMTAQLLKLQLQDMKSEECRGVIFEGVLNRVVELPSLLSSLVPKRSNKYEELYKLWCEGLDVALAERARIKAEEDAIAADAAAVAAAEADAAAAEAAAELEASKHNRSPRKKHGRSASRASVQTTASVLDANQPPTPPPEEVPALLAVARVKLDEPVKKEVRSKGAKRGVDLSQLPPPELPPVDDITQEVKREEEFIARAIDELQSYTGLLSCIMYVNCSQEEIFRRFAGLRIDRDTSEQYHLLYNPPPKARVPYLIGCDRTTSFSSVLYDVVFRQKQEWEELRKWLLKQPNLCNRVHELMGDQPLDQIAVNAEELVQRAIESFNIGKKLYDAMLDALDRIATLKKTRADQAAAREAERVRLAELYTEKGVPLPPELEVTGDVGSWCPIPEDVPPMVLKVVQEFHHHYAKTYHVAWNEFSSLSCMILEYRRSARSQLKRFWGQPDEKQVILDRFLRQFNSLPKRFRCKSPCKEELHLLTDELSTELFACVESKRKDGMSLIDHVVRRDAYLDGWEANVCNIGALMVQQEVERFTLVVNLSMLYFAAALEEPVMFEEVDTDVSLIRTLEAATGDLAGSSKNKSDKRSVGARKGHGRPNEESGDSTILEAFSETVQRLVNAVTSLTEKFKLKVTADASGKGQKKVTLRSLKLSAITASCIPFLETEQAAALDRIASVKRFVTELARQGEAYMQSIKLEMMSEARQMLIRQAGAVNSAIFTVRCAIEEEDEAPPMHIGCGTFSVLRPKVRDHVAIANAVKNPCFITDVPLYATGGDLITPVHDTLNGSRLLELIQLFRCAAPKYQLCCDSFTTIVNDEDYAGAAKEGEYILGTGEVFRLFDPMNTGTIDWRELVMHLLFWCCPPAAKGEATRYIPEVTIAELLEMKKHLYQEPVTEDHFRECPFFFDKYLKPDRRNVYVRALWYTFQRGNEPTIDPFDFLCFFCIDSQPIRGIQKAFHILSNGTEMLSMPEMERMLHVRATNARAMALLDPFSKPNLYILMGSRKIISFKDVCACAMGRCLLNRFDFMMRKKFVCQVS